MQFVSRAERYIVVVPGHQAWHEQIGPNSQYHRGLRATFTNHKFDSEKVQKQMGWTEEDRKLVEQAIMDAEDWGVALYLDTRIEQKQSKAKGLRLRCVAFDPDPNAGGEAVQCQNYAVEGEDYCEGHMMLVKKTAAEAAPSWAGEEADDMEEAGV